MAHRGEAAAMRRDPLARHAGGRRGICQRLWLWHTSPSMTLTSRAPSSLCRGTDTGAAAACVGAELPVGLASTSGASSISFSFSIIRIIRGR